MLEEGAYIQKIPRRRENGSSTSNVYRFPSVSLTRGGFQGDTPPSVPVTPPEPELRTRKEPIAAAPRKRNEIWDALTYVFGEPTVPTAIKLRGQVCRDLAAAGATKDQVIARASAWPAHFDSATLTDTALRKHWDTLGRKPLRRTG